MLFILNQDEKVVAVLNNTSPDACPYWNDRHHEVLGDSLSTYEFEAPLQHESSQHLVAENYVARTDLDGNYLLFKIKMVDEYLKDGIYVKHVLAENAAISELNGTIIRPKVMTGWDADSALDYVLADTRWEKGQCDFLGTATLNLTDYPTALAALHSIAKAFEGELRYRISLKNGVISARYIDLLERRGRDTGKRFEYRKDIKGIKRTEDSTRLATALIGLGKADEKGVRMTFASVNNGLDWIGDDEALDRFGKDGRHIFGVYEDTEAENPTDLLERTRKELEKRKKPILTYEVDVILLESLADWEHEAVRLGDTVRVIDLTFTPEIVLNARVIELTRSYTDPTQDKVVLGEFVPLSLSVPSIVRSMQKALIENTGILQGKETVHKGKTPPDDKSQLWLDLSQEPYVWKKYDETTGEWKKATPTQASEVGAETPAGAQQKAETAKQEAMEYADQAASTAEQNAKQYAEQYTQQYAEQKAPSATPAAPTNFSATGAFKKVILKWDIDTSKTVAYYELYASQTAGFTPNSANLLWKGKASGYTHDADVNQTWYYRLRAVNAYGQAGAFTNEVSASTVKIISDDILFGAVNAQHIADLAITAEKLADGAVTGSKIANNAVDNTKLADLSVSAQKLQNGIIDNSKLADLAITAQKLADGSITTPKIADGAVNTAKIVDDAITNAKIAAGAVGNAELDRSTANKIQIATNDIINGAITTLKIASNAVDNSKLADLAITAAKLADGAVTNTKIAAGAIDNSKLADLSISAQKLQNGIIDNSKLADLAVTAAKLAAGSVDNTKLDRTSPNRIQIDSADIKDAAITSAKIGSLAVGTGAIQDAAIVSAKIANLAVGTGAIQDGSITNAKIANAAVDSAKIADASITSAKIANAAVGAAAIAAAAIGTAHIQDGAITNAKIQNLDASKITSGTIDANRIGANTITTDKLIISDFTNLCENPDFEGDSVGSNPKGYTTNSSCRVADISGFVNGNGSNRALEIDAKNGSNNDIYSSNIFPVRPDQQFYVEAEARYLNTAGTGWLRIGFRRYDDKKQPLSSWIEVVKWDGTKSTTFTKKSGTFTVPSGTGYLQIWISFLNNGETTNKAYIDNIRVHRMANGELIVDGAITASKIAANTITAGSAIIQDGAITTAKIADAAINSAKIASAAIGTAAIADAAITNAKIANLAVGTAAIADAAITQVKIAQAAIDTAQIKDASITSAKIASLAVGNAAIQNAAITNAKISNLAVGTAQIQDGAITNAKIANLAVDDAKIASLHGSKITASSITADKLNVSSLSAISANLGTVTAGTLRAVTLDSATGTFSGSLKTNNLIIDSELSQRHEIRLRMSDNNGVNYVVVEGDYTQATGNVLDIHRELNGSPTNFDLVSLSTYALDLNNGQLLAGSVTVNGDSYVKGSYVIKTPDRGWIAPTLLNGWVNYGSGYEAAGYYKDALGFIHLKGLIKSGTMGTAAFNLPSGYRPSYRKMFIVPTSGGAGRVDIDPSGDVIVMTYGSSANGYVSLDGIIFNT
jgi:phage minor structural protein